MGEFWQISDIREAGTLFCDDGKGLICDLQFKFATGGAPFHPSYFHESFTLMP